MINQNDLEKNGKADFRSWRLLLFAVPAVASRLRITVLRGSRDRAEFSEYSARLVIVLTLS